MAVRLSREGRVARLLIDRPPLNILDLATLAELHDRLLELSAEGGVQLLVLEGAGERAFSAGVAVEDHAPEKLDRMLSSFHGAVRALRGLPGITLAVVQGHCLGGGCELATACDLVLAAEDASLGVPEVELGCLPPIAAALFPRRLGAATALDLILTGRRVDGREARELGLVHWAVPAVQLAARRDQEIARLTRHSAAVCRLIKRAARWGEALPFEQALERVENLYLDELANTDDMQEGLAAFLEKRPARWRHR